MSPDVSVSLGVVYLLFDLCLYQSPGRLFLLHSFDSAIDNPPAVPPGLCVRLSLLSQPLSLCLSPLRYLSVSLSVSLCPMSLSLSLCISLSYAFFLRDVSPSLCLSVPLSDVSPP